MDPERHRRISELFLQACELAPEARGPFLDEACAEDPELRVEVESLLAQEGDASRVLAGIDPGQGASAAAEALHPSQLPTLPGASAERSLPAGPLPRPFGRFRLLRLIGRGGMGEVYEAEDTQLVRRVALKTLLAAEGRADSAARFLQEARIAGTLDHPNVVPVYDYGIVDGTAYYTMPLVDGHSLEELIPFLHRRAQGAPPLFLEIPESWSDRVGLVLDWFAGALDGLEHAHEKGIVHRDVKPSNLILDSHDRRLRLADFGLARAPHLSGLTRAGSMMGTVAYMAPEQVRSDSGRIDSRTDVYSMGVTLYRTLLDRLPYEADTTAAYLNRIIAAQPDDPGRRGPGLPRDLVTILLKCMEKVPGHRYATAGALAADIRRFRRYEPIAARPVGIAGRLARWTRRRPAVAALAAGLMVAALVLGALARVNLRASAILRGQEIETSLRLANYALARKDHVDALARFGRAIELDPRSLDGRMGRAVVAVAQLAGDDPSANPRAALNDLDVAASIEPDLVSVHVLRGRLLAELGDPAGGAREREQAAQLEPRVALDFRLLGDTARAEGDCRAAIASYDRALADDPRLSLAALGRGVCYRALGDLPRAERDAAVASHLVPEDAHPHINLGNVLAAQGKFDEAFREYERALEIEPATALYHFNYGESLRASGDLDTAEARFRRALELDPRLAKAHNNLGYVLAETERLEDAVAAFRAAIAIEDGKATGKNPADYLVAYTGLCDVAVRARDLGQARESCGKALELAPEDPDGHYNLAALRMLEGDLDAALDSLRRDVDLGDRDFDYLLADSTFDPLHGDGRFQALVERMRTPNAD